MPLQAPFPAAPFPAAPLLHAHQPLLIEPAFAAHAVRALIETGRAPLPAPDARDAAAARQRAFDGDFPSAPTYGWHADAAAIEPRYALQDGVAIVPVRGPLWHAGYAWGTNTYAGLRLQLAHAFDAANVEAVMLDIDSPGGDVAGLFDLVDWIAARAARGVSKPVWALANERATSAAYAIAAACDRIVLPRTADTGSIGVITSHVDFSGMDARMGVTVTEVFAGEGKADLSPFAALSEPARARLQADVDRTYALFIATVARLRAPEGSPAAAADIEALGAFTYTGAEAVAVGLADEVMTARDALAHLIEIAQTPARARNARQPTPAATPAATSGVVPAANTGADPMTLKDKALARAAAATRAQALASRATGAMDDDEDDETVPGTAPAPTSKNHKDTPAAEGEDDKKTAEGEDDDETAESEEDEDMAEGEEDDEDAEGEDDDEDAEDEDESPKARGKGARRTAASERARIAAIVGAPEAKGREDLAQHFAFATGMAPKAALAALRKAPLGAAETGKPGLARRMASTAVPDTGAGGTAAAATPAQALKARAARRRAEADRAAGTPRRLRG